MSRSLHRVLLASCLHLSMAVTACGSTDDSNPAAPGVIVVTAGDSAAFRAAVEAAGPGDRIELPPGEYGSGHFFTGLHGEAGRPIVIAAADPDDPPTFTGGTEAIHLIEPEYVELHHLRLSGQSGNGLNIDDGGSFETPARHVLLRGLVVHDIGPEGNHDGIKLSGLTDFRVEDCTVERWGSDGSGIDLVGCHRGLITGCTFRHGDDAGSNSIQVKGGSADIVLRANRFEHGGRRAVNIGGSTGLQFFRPQPYSGFEATRVTVEGNVFIGSTAPVAFVSVDGSTFRFNTVYRPTGWVLRILQENRTEGFIPCRGGIVADNLILFRSDELRAFVNIGPDTAPETFRFERNLWYALDNPSASAPDLPSERVHGVVGVDPKLTDPAAGDFGPTAASPEAARVVGAHALARSD
jgi:hypothetical protein